MCFVVIVGYHTKSIFDTFHACVTFAHIVHTTILQDKKENPSTRMMMITTTFMYIVCGRGNILILMLESVHEFVNKDKHPKKQLCCDVKYSYKHEFRKYI